MGVKQIALARSGPPLSSNVLNACIGRVAYVSTLMITLHVYKPSVQEKHERVHRGISYPANFVW